MDLIQLLQGLQQQIVDAAASAQALGDQKFKEGADSRQVEVDGLNAQIVDLTAKLAAAQNPNPDPLQAQVDALTAQVADLTKQVSDGQAQVVDLQTQVAAKDQAFADFKATELEKVKGIEVDFT